MEKERYKRNKDIMSAYFVENEIPDETFCGGEDVKETVLTVVGDLYACDEVEKDIKNPNAFFNYIRTAVERHFNASGQFHEGAEVLVDGIIVSVEDKDDRMLYAMLKTEEEIKKILKEDE